MPYTLLTRLRHPTRGALAACLAFALWHQPLGATASSGCTEANERCVATGTWEFQIAVGAGVRTNPIAAADDIPLVLIPQITYYGKRFFLDNLDLGYTLVDRPDWMLNALVTVGGDGLYFFEDSWGRFVLDGGLGTLESGFNKAPAAPGEGDAANDGDAGFGPVEDSSDEGPTEAPRQSHLPKLRERNIAALAGVETSGQMGRFEWQLQALSDASNVHDGQELRFAVSTATQAREHHLGMSVGFNWKSAEVMEYYYGVTQGESGTGRPAYRPDSGTSPFVRLSWTRPAGEHWRWLGSVQYEHLSEAIRHSPLIDRKQVIQIFFGGVYHF
ncbi:MipA/OmpV family protein [Marinimicrobium agarilyticum]|uniref:MipA/OmpV family protein n=1 Tax=Marinimicrobium agarilyticum TaxID=306546 RepID=UPI00041E8602|nr:MipA/OmpV family protein [Marinimicrobium agarilyticum]